MIGNKFSRTVFKNTAFSNTVFGEKADTFLKQSTAVFDASRIDQADGSSVASFPEIFARYTATQTVEAAKPTLDIDAINGNPGVLFQTDDYFETDISADTEDFFFLFLGKHVGASPTSIQMVLSAQASSNRNFFGFYNGYFVAAAGDLTNSVCKSKRQVASTGELFIGTVVRENKNVKLFINGILEFEGAYTTSAINIFNYRIGAHNYQDSAASYFFNGVIGELVADKKAVTANERILFERKAGAIGGITVHRKTVIFLIAGQSNTHYGGGLDAEIDVYPERVWQLGRGDDDMVLVPAVEPIQHTTAQEGKIGFTNAFVKKYRENNPDVDVIVVPCGAASTGFEDNRWNPGDDLYEDAVARVNKITSLYPYASFGGVLWLQGEDDVGDAGHAEALDAMIAGMRSDINAASATTPFILGQMVPVWVAADADRQATQAIINDTPNRVSGTAVVLSDGITTNNIHYTAADQRILGGRFYDAFVSLT